MRIWPMKVKTTYYVENNNNERPGTTFSPPPKMKGTERFWRKLWSLTKVACHWGCQCACRVRGLVSAQSLTGYKRVCGFVKIDVLKFWQWLGRTRRIYCLVCVGKDDFEQCRSHCRKKSWSQLEPPIPPIHIMDVHAVKTDKVCYRRWFSHRFCYRLWSTRHSTQPFWQTPWRCSWKFWRMGSPSSLQSRTCRSVCVWLCVKSEAPLNVLMVPGEQSSKISFEI